MSDLRIFNSDQIKNLINNTSSIRDRAFLMIGFNTGLRIKELLNLKLGDIVMEDNNSFIIIKSKNIERNIKLNSDAIKAIQQIVEWLKSKGLTDKSTPLFLSQKKTVNNEYKAISRQQAHDLLKLLLAKIEEFNISVGVMRRTFGFNILRQTKSFKKTQIALNHKSLVNTVKYLYKNLN
jgi:site-specific recombinase XerD